ncbi:hypothetical protein CHRYSEO8AT_290038 [Chryseobacterium sp. 8AT]|nr:hypothetical protein CHRYSEO8AT_290038 [Chryseobacterium sp. 8AT]
MKLFIVHDKNFKYRLPQKESKEVIVKIAIQMFKKNVKF